MMISLYNQLMATAYYRRRRCRHGRHFSSNTQQLAHAMIHALTSRPGVYPHILGAGGALCHTVRAPECCTSGVLLQSGIMKMLNPALPFLVHDCQHVHHFFRQHTIHVKRVPPAQHSWSAHGVSRRQPC
jgi:hypothetical protein